MIAVVNYGLGNLHSVQKAIDFAGGSARVTDDPETILQAGKVVLPGVGAFDDGMRGLVSLGLDAVIKEVVHLQIPLLGICLGMQLFFEESSEQGMHQGLGLMRGQVKAFQGPGVKVPQIGWNQLDLIKTSPLLKGLHQGCYVYFNHGYYCSPADDTDEITATEYGIKYTSAVQRGNLFGVQFHPEKSQKIGLQIIRNFVEL